jgi:hypothetical protein
MDLSKFKILRGITNIIFLILNLKITNYFKIERRIIQDLSRYKDHKILLISGGDTLYNNLHLIDDYNFIAMNSFNTYERLPCAFKNSINERLIFYYQAPYHQPIVLRDYQNSINNVLLNISKNSVNVCNLTGEISFYQRSPCNYEFRILSNLNFFGKHVQASSGVLTMLSFLELAGFKNIDVLGADFDWIPFDGVKSSKELEETYESLLSFFKHFYKFKKSLLKKGVVIRHLVDKALLNLN